MPDPIDVYVGSEIRRVRVDRGLTQTQLATASGTTFQQLQKYESGDNRVSASRLYRICCALRIEVASLFPPICEDAEVGAAYKGGRRVKPSFDHIMEMLSTDDRKVVTAVAEALARKTKDTVLTVNAID